MMDALPLVSTIAGVVGGLISLSGLTDALRQRRAVTRLEADRSGCVLCDATISESTPAGADPACVWWGAETVEEWERPGDDGNDVSSEKIVDRSRSGDWVLVRVPGETMRARVCPSTERDLPHQIVPLEFDRNARADGVLGTLGRVLEGEKLVAKYHRVRELRVGQSFVLAGTVTTGSDGVRQVEPVEGLATLTPGDVSTLKQGLARKPRSYGVALVVFTAAGAAGVLALI